MRTTNANDLMRERESRRNLEEEKEWRERDIRALGEEEEKGKGGGGRRSIINGTKRV